MEHRITTFSEFVMAVVNDVKAIDSQTVNGASVIKISFQPQVRIDAAMSQIGAAFQAIRFRMPPGQLSTLFLRVVHQERIRRDGLRSRWPPSFQRLRLPKDLVRALL